MTQQVTKALASLIAPHLEPGERLLDIGDAIPPATCWIAPRATTSPEGWAPPPGSAWRRSVCERCLRSGTREPADNGGRSHKRAEPLTHGHNRRYRKRPPWCARLPWRVGYLPDGAIQNLNPYPNQPAAGS